MKVSVVGQRVRRRMVDLNISTVKELENIAGLPRDSVRHLVSGRTNSLRAGKLPALAAALKMSVEELVGGSPMAGDASSVIVPLAAQVANTAQQGRVRFDASILPAFGADIQGQLRLVVAAGDNMHPTIAAGDVVLVDSVVQQVAGDGIYYLQLGNTGAGFRRVQVQAKGGTAALICDNQKYATEAGVDSASLQVLGLVLGHYRKI